MAVALRNALRSKYPTLQLSEQWLGSCVDFLRANTDVPLDDATLLRAVDEQILAADLADLSEASVLPTGLGDDERTVVGAGGPRSRFLVQIVAISDAGVSAQTQLDVAEARLEASKTLGGRELLDTPPEQDERDPEDPMRTFEEQENASNAASTVFSRSMLRLEVSDGYVTMPAFETVRINELSLAGTPLGAKLLLINAPVRRGHILLQPRNTTVLGGSVDELQLAGTVKLINTMRTRLGKPLLDLNRDPVPKQEAVEAGAEMPLAPALQPPSSPDFIEVLSDDADEMAMFQAVEQAEAEAAARGTVGRSPEVIDVTSSP